ncbi:MAG: hypothetical protein UV98_C0031G0006 [Parcubacteria group bacterium GW2011_GWB1_43_6]|nr:MAG: hypothetical protein UV98_C0031G0006 [Parcubacteria group bacterium GW2011_GWB1_43_6]
MKVGRNNPCPCNSGKKYKKCCLSKHMQPPIKEIIEMAMNVLKKQQEERLALQGRGIFVNYVKPCTYINPKTGQKVRAWALGSRLFHTRPEYETFHGFIIDHLQKQVMGKDWWVEQLQAQQKHFLFKCFIKWDEWRKRNATEKNRADEHTWYAITDGWAKTLSSLAFDVCTLEHTLQLPEYILKRLRNRGEYQGAHYEIAVAAIFARLGCRIDFLDKDKHTTPHCEFIATHNETGVSIAVEAKSRQKPGVKHMAGTSEQERLLRGDVERLFKKALTQNPKDKPFVIFIDVNAPLTPSISMENKPWFKDIRNILEKYPAPTPDNPEEYTGLFFTNFSPHYDEEKESSPNEHLVVIPLYAKYPMPNQVFGEMLLKAVQNYGFVPNIMEDK